MDWKIGADPEFFLKKDGKPHSGVGVIPGTKKKPVKVKSGAVQLDGLAAEFNIDPASTRTQFVSNVKTVLKELRSIVPKEFDFDYSPVAHFEEKHFLEQPEFARELGCNPDFNAYTGRVNSSPKEVKFMRTAAGHVHVGWTENEETMDENHYNLCCRLTKQLDVALGLPSVILDPNKERRVMYGKAGAFRPKPYGLEYRVLSNFWLKSDSLIRWVWDNTVEALEAAVNDKWFSFPEKLVEDTINNSNVEAALSLVGNPKVR